MREYCIPLNLYVLCPCTESNPVETGFYYLNSRYYDPSVGRFINSDVYASTGQGVLDSNMFTYCKNNPVNYDDPSGYSCSDYDWDLHFVLLYATQAATPTASIEPSSSGGFIEEIFNKGLDNFRSGDPILSCWLSDMDFETFVRFCNSYTGKNGTEYYWWGRRVYIDGPTCEEMVFTARVSSGVITIAIALRLLPPQCGFVSGALVIEAALVEKYNNGQGVYCDVYWPHIYIIGYPFTGVYSALSMRSQ